MSDDSARARKVKLRVLLSELRAKQGSGTELVTLIIPPDRQISDARGMLQNEHGQAANIKSKSTKKNVQAAIESAISALSQYKTPGEFGLAIFVGAVKIPGVNNKTEKYSLVISDPPQPFVSFRYRCDSRFEITQLESMLVDNEAYGLFVIDRSEAAYGLAVGKNIHIQEHLTSNIMGKHRQGGQSAQRFERLIEEAAHNFFKRATEHASDYWLPNIENIKAIIVGGPGATKDYVVKNDYFHHEIQKKLAKTHLDVGYSNDSGIRELVQNAGPLMGEIELDEERKEVEQFLVELIKAHPKATYGALGISKAINMGAVDKLLISEKILHKASIGHEIIGHADGEPVKRCLTKENSESGDHDCQTRAHDCKYAYIIKVDDGEDEAVAASLTKGSEHELGSKAAHFMENLETIASETQINVVYISDNTEEGSQLLHGFYGMGAVLRYPLM